MKVIYDIPPRLKTKKGLAGDYENKDIAYAGGLGLAGAISVFTIGKINMVLGLSILAICVGLAWFLFLNPYKYGESFRIWFGRYKKFNSSQKLYYFRRTSNPIIHMDIPKKEDPSDLFEL